MSARSSWVPWAALISLTACDPGAPLVSPPARGARAPASVAASVPASVASSVPAAVASSVPAPAPVSGPAAGLVVDTPGDEPRFRLDAPPAAGVAHRMRLTVATAAAAGPEGGRTAFTGVPGVVLDLDTQAANRPGWVALRLSQARATDAAAGPSAVAPAADASLVSLVNGALQPLTGLVAEAPRAAASGEGALHPQPWRFAPPPGAPAEAAELLGNLHDAIDPLTLALPAVPLGIGAKFTETLVLAGPPGAPGVTLVRSAEVVRIDPEGARLAVTLRFRGTTRPPGGDAGRAHRVAPAGELEGDGEGSIEIAVGRPFPIRGTLTLETRRTAVLPSDAGGAGRAGPAWRLTTRMALTLEPR
jgi:hypothetical protein